MVGGLISVNATLGSAQYLFAMQSQRLGNATIKLDIRSVHRKRIIQFMRTMMAIAIALSVALLPVSGAAVASVKSSEQSIPADVSMPAGMSAGMDDCCPDHAKPCPQAGDDCQSMASCSTSSVNLANLADPEFRYPALTGNPLSVLEEHAVPPLGGSPPFRPPRV
jgi:hypothetical protein